MARHEEFEERRTGIGRLGLDTGGPDRPVPRSTLADRLDDALDRLDRVRDRPMALASGVVLIAVLLGVGWWTGRSPARSQPIEEVIPQVSLATTTPATRAGTSSGGELIVHVVGAVRRPGVYVLSADDRVLDAVDAAGGATTDADLQQLNLAAPLADGLQIRVPVEGEVVVPLGGSETTSGPIDVNRADATALDALPGIGPATAAAIVAWRDENGPFASVEDLLLVPGIGPAKLAALADSVVVS